MLLIKTYVSKLINEYRFLHEINLNFQPEMQPKGGVIDN